MAQKVAINKFVERQTADSRFSHFAGIWDELVELVKANFEKAKPGYRDGVMTVPVPADRFFSGVVELVEDTPLKAEFSARRKGEEPYINVVAVGGEKIPAKAVEIVVYRHDVLEADGDASTDAEWEVISINARPTDEPEPMTPVAMARNFLELVGGTKAEYTAEQFAQSIIYWSKRAMRG